MLCTKQSVNYTAYCVLTDVELQVTVDSGWHPSHLEVFDPRTRLSRIVLFRHNRDCAMSTNLTITGDKQVPAVLYRINTEGRFLGAALSFNLLIEN